MHQIHIIVITVGFFYLNGSNALIIVSARHV